MIPLENSMANFENHKTRIKSHSLSNYCHIHIFIGIKFQKNKKEKNS